MSITKSSLYAATTVLRQSSVRWLLALAGGDGCR